jgi:hypothetical protein
MSEQLSPQQIKDVAVLMYKGHTQTSIMAHTGLSLEDVRRAQILCVSNPFEKERSGNITYHHLEKLEQDLFKAIDKLQNGRCGFKDIDDYAELKHRYVHALL